MAETTYELRIGFNSPGEMGAAADVILPALIEAGIAAQPIVKDVAIEDGEARELNELENAAVEAAPEQGGPAAGTIEYEQGEEEEEE